MTNQELLESLLKHKGIGPEGSKSLQTPELAKLSECLQDQSVSLITRSTMMTAMLALSPNEAEANWIESLKANFKVQLPSDLHWFISGPTNALQSLIQKTIKHQELNEAECKQGVAHILSGEDPALSASLLEAERLKRETFDENYWFYQSILEKSTSIQVDIPFLIDISDSYDGSKRTNPYSVFTCALLASLKIPVYMHSLVSVAPKEGITAHQILKAAGKNPLKSLEKAKNELERSHWTYIDQAVFSPELHSLQSMRKLMVKRPFLATFEKLLSPIRANQNHLVTCYTHPAYRIQLVELINKVGLYKRVLNVKGVESTTQAHLNKDTSLVKSVDGQIEETSFSPLSFREKDTITVPKEIVKNGLSALKGEKNHAYYQIANHAAMIIIQILDYPRDEAFELIHESMNNGNALRSWDEFE